MLGKRPHSSQSESDGDLTQNDGNQGEGPPPAHKPQVASRRFLSACMEDIEPIMEQRGKDCMYQCCYCGKWCTMSGTRALSKHIENEHRPQVVINFLSALEKLDVTLRPGETRYVYCAFMPLEHWNVHVEASINFSSVAHHPWASLHPIHELSHSGSEGTNRGRQSLHLKMVSAQPYLPRPKWDENQHGKQRVGMRVATSLKDAFECNSDGQRPTSGFVVKFEGFSSVIGLDETVNGEIDVALKVHGKETAIVLPLSMRIQSDVNRTQSDVATFGNINSMPVGNNNAFGNMFPNLANNGLRIPSGGEQPSFARASSDKASGYSNNFNNNFNPQGFNVNSKLAGQEDFQSVQPSIAQSAQLSNPNIGISHVGSNMNPINPLLLMNQMNQGQQNNMNSNMNNNMNQGLNNFFGQQGMQDPMMFRAGSNSSQVA
eukprot:CAMPEP_0184310036 /NCGR_PEP_ID=MMETSP1049-20130417/22550_1 /TAXON_ID=77928 /ORGANISM="Proteomonas sulcata, Strain CCMP704" /LENGTH=430 /DNA_ID=CAMNT_0026623461 /DNA_START=443 /DNA_END=1735 /DNA_ORIENTATION=+